MKNLKFYNPEIYYLWNDFSSMRTYSHFFYTFALLWGIYNHGLQIWDLKGSSYMNNLILLIYILNNDTLFVKISLKKSQFLLVLLLRYFSKCYLFFFILFAAKFLTLFIIEIITCDNIVSEGKRKQLFNHLLNEFRNSKVSLGASPGGGLPNASGLNSSHQTPHYLSGTGPA